MTDPISFSPFLGWVDITDPNSIPPDARLITAADLLRYENFGKDAAALLISIAGNTADVVHTARTVSTGPGLLGGGDLTADKALSLAGANSAGRWGLIGHMYPASSAGATVPALTSGTLYVMKVTAEDAAVAATRTVRIWQGSASAGLTLAKCAVFDSTGAKLGSDSTDQSSTLNGSGNTARNITVGSFALTKGAVYYVALLVVGTTGPVLAGSSTSGVANAGLSGSSLLWSTNGTGLSSIPASITPSSAAAQPSALWCGLL